MRIFSPLSTSGKRTKKRETKDRKGESIVLSNIASVMYDSGNYRDAIQMYEQSLEISEELNDEAGTSDLLASIASVYENT